MMAEDLFHLNSFSPQATLTILLLLLAGILASPQAQAQHPAEDNDQTCAVLYSGENFTEKELVFGDGSLSVNLPEEHHLAEGGWNVTGSLKISNGCLLELCEETYIQGECKSLNGSSSSFDKASTWEMRDILSARCNCKKESNCGDIWMKKNSCSRAYLKGGCRTSHPLYMDLNGNGSYFPERLARKVESLVIRKGCSLRLYKEQDFEGDYESYDDQDVVEQYRGNVRSYRCSCDDSKFVQRVKPPRSTSYPPLIDIPQKLDDVMLMLKNKTYSDHPGLLAAYQSLRNRRSSTNAYILLLGSSGSGKSSAINLLFDNPNVTKVGEDVSTTTNIHEFRIPIPVDDIGVQNSQLRVIDTPGIPDTRGVQQDATFLATLDDYLGSHEELHERLPNVVLIFHKFTDNRIIGPGAQFIHLLRGLDSFRQRITDDKFSNVIFVLSHFCSDPTHKKKPDKKLASFKSAIADYSLFPKPIILTVAENKPEDNELPMFNGFYKLPNNEYYPKNLFKNMELVTRKGGDMMGLGIFRTAFKDSSNFNITSTTYPLRNQSSKIDKYFRILSNSLLSINETEVSKLLQDTWDQKLDANLTRNFKDSLPYLQKALNLRNIRSREDIPRTTTGILALLASIRTDDAVRELLKIGLNIEAPTFPSNQIAGYSFSVFKDNSLPYSPFSMDDDVQGSDIGYLLPNVLTCKLRPNTAQVFHNFDNLHDYIQHRLQSLDIAGSIPDDMFSGTPKPGHNIVPLALNQTGCHLSASQEYRLFDLLLNYNSTLNQNFEKALMRLQPFNGSDHDNVENWKNFFNDYGTHVVRSVHGGGAIEVHITQNDKPCDDNMLTALKNGLKFVEDMAFMIDYDGGVNGTTMSKLISLKFIGGDPRFHISGLEGLSIDDASKLLTNWKDSLRLYPAILTSEMRLAPIGQVVKHLGKSYSSEIDRSTSLIFGSQLKYIPPTRNGEDNPGSAREDMELMLEHMTNQSEHQARMLKELQETIVKQQEMLQNQTLDMARMQNETIEMRKTYDKKILEETRKREQEARLNRQRHEQDLAKQRKELQDGAGRNRKLAYCNSPNWISQSAIRNYQATNGRGMDYAGREGGGINLHVCAADYKGHLYPGKYYQSSKYYDTCYIGAEGVEYYRHSFMVLELKKGYFKWVGVSGRNFPGHKIQVGTDRSGKSTYICRAHYQGRVIPGRVMKEDGYCRFPHGDKEHSAWSYSLLVCNV